MKLSFRTISSKFTNGTSFPVLLLVISTSSMGSIVGSASVASSYEAQQQDDYANELADMRRDRDLWLARISFLEQLGMDDLATYGAQQLSRFDEAISLLENGQAQRAFSQEQTVRRALEEMEQNAIQRMTLADIDRMRRIRLEGERPQGTGPVDRERVGGSGRRTDPTQAQLDEAWDKIANLRATAHHLELLGREELSAEYEHEADEMERAVRDGSYFDPAHGLANEPATKADIAELRQEIRSLRETIEQLSQSIERLNRAIGQRR